MILSCQNIAKAFGEEEILRSISFHIEENEKAAIVGVNGAGKTTLLRIITGESSADSGTVAVSRGVRIGCLSQQNALNEEDTIDASLRSAKQYVIAMSERIRQLEKEMKDTDADSLNDILEEYHRLTVSYEQENGFMLESEITGVLKGLGFTEEDRNRRIRTLSGGQKMRVALGRLLLTRPDLLLLDEPTNHLDLQSVRWLEGYISSYKGAVILVSHDRTFIDRTTSMIIEIDQGKSGVFRGDYSHYREEKKKLREARQHAWLNQQKEIRHSEEVIAKLKQFNREKSIKRAESREKMLDKVERLEKPTETRTDMRLTLTPVTESGEDVLILDHVKKAFGQNLLFSGLSFILHRGEHAALIGANGTGKTTLLKLIARKLARDEGTITLGARVRIGYFDQEHQDLSPDKTLFEELSDSFPDMTDTKLRNTLAAFLFTGDDVFKKISDLSGGEQGRLSLAKLMLSPANFLILDEPTNHLDLPSREILEEALKNYTGTILMVSHDRYFINQTASRILELRDGLLTDYKGSYDDYEENRDTLFAIQHGKTGEDAFSVNETGKSSPGMAPADADKNSTGRDAYLKNKADAAKERKRLNDLKKTEDAIEKAENRISEIENEMSLPENSVNAEALTRLSEEAASLNEELENLYEKWEELQLEE